MSKQSQSEDLAVKSGIETQLLIFHDREVDISKYSDVCERYLKDLELNLKTLNESQRQLNLDYQIEFITHHMSQIYFDPEKMRYSVDKSVVSELRTVLESLRELKKEPKAGWNKTDTPKHRFFYNEGGWETMEKWLDWKGYIGPNRQWNYVSGKKKEILALVFLLAGSELTRVSSKEEVYRIFKKEFSWEYTNRSDSINEEHLREFSLLVKHLKKEIDKN